MLTYSVIQSLISSSKLGYFVLAIFLQGTVMRKRGGFYYRTFVVCCIISFVAFYSFTTLALFRLLGYKKIVASKHNGKVVAFLMRTLLAIEIKMEGRENFLSEDQPAIYLCNHQTILDLVLTPLCWPPHASFIVKKAIKYYPIVGWFFMMDNAVFLDRKNNSDAVAQMRVAAQQVNRNKASIFAFPEGTRNGGRTVDLLPFKKGVFYMATEAKVPIVPLVIECQKDIYNSKTKHFGYGTLRVKVLPAMDTKDFTMESESISKLSDITRQQMLNALTEISTAEVKPKTTYFASKI